MKKNEKFLFGEFPPVSAEEWKEKIIADLKGIPYDTLITKTLEGIEIQPFYHRETYRYIPFSYRPRGFKIVRPLIAPPGEEEITRAKSEKIDILRVETDIPPVAKPHGKLRLAVTAPQMNESLARQLSDARIDFSFNPLTRLVRTGAWQKSEKDDFRRFMDALNRYPAMQVEIDAAAPQNAGAHIVQQIAFALSQANDLTERVGKAVIPRIRFKTAVGYHYFFEMAKFKALRYLWHKLSKRKRTRIYAEPSLRNKSVLDPYMNMLRTGMESMAAVLGGADEVGNYPYDYLMNGGTSHSRRLASNQLILLKTEAKFQAAAGATEKSYYIEHIAYELARRALELWKEWEKRGNFTRNFLSGTIQSAVRNTAQIEQAWFDEGKLTLTGVNKYPLENEMPSPARIPIPSEDVKERIAEPLRLRRLAEKIELTRFRQNEKR